MAPTPSKEHIGIPDYNACLCGVMVQPRDINAQLQTS